MRKTIGLLTLLAAVSTSVGCSFIARGEDQYRTDTRTVLSEREGQIQGCYDKALEADAALSGSVVVQFTVEKKSGSLTGVAAAEGSTAPAALTDCVLTALDGLQLKPEDRRDGQATFTYTFSGPAAGAGKSAL